MVSSRQYGIFLTVATEIMDFCGSAASFLDYHE
jgi:hypothetical protein